MQLVKNSLAALLVKVERATVYSVLQPPQLRLSLSLYCHSIFGRSLQAGLCDLQRGIEWKCIQSRPAMY